jgi:subtilisin family serine protease
MTGRHFTPSLRAAIALAALAMAACALAPAARAASRVDPAMLQRSGADAKVDVIVVLRRQAVLPVGPRIRRRAIIDALRGVADKEQRRLLALLAIRRLQGRVTKIRSFWILNGLEVVADPDVITEIAALPEVAEIRPNAVVEAPSAPLSSPGAEWNVARANATALWDQGYRGQGVVVANMDTGVDATHPDLAARWRGGANSWYDPNGEHPTTPVDRNGHGTWTMGTMVGGDAGGSAIGIAPDARWIGVKIFNDHGTATAAGIHAGFQWLLDPDHNPATDDAPDVVNNSWSMGFGCDLTFEPDLTALRASGVVAVFAAGNSGPNAGTSTSPANNPDAFAVGGTDGGDAIDPSSSRGPSACGQGTFPQLVAPGVDVRTSDLFGSYMSVTGTSIAAPHAAGALALLLSAFPGLDEQRQAAALQNGAVDLGAPGPDNDFGAGRLDALASYQWLATAPDFSLAATPSSVTTAAGGTASYSVDVQALNGFAGDVALSLTGLPANQASWTFNPGVVPGGTGSAQLTVTTLALAPGTYSLTITGTSGTSTRSARAELVIPPPPDFSLAVTPAARTTAPGGAVDYTVSTTAVGGFTGDVALSLSGLTAAQATWSFAPASIAGAAGASQLTLSTASAIAPGRYTLTITGTSGSVSHSVTVTLIVPDFSLSVSPTSRTTTPGTAVTYTVSVGAINGFTGTVSLALSGLSQGSWTFAPASITNAGTSTLTVTAAAAGTYSLTITGTSGAIVHTRTVTLVAGVAADFGVSVSPASATVVAGQSVAYTVSVSSVGGFAGSVSLSAGGLPALATASFSSNPVIAPRTVTMTVRTSRLTPRGTFALTVTGRSGSLVHTAGATIVVRS